MEQVTNRELENRILDLSTVIREDMAELRTALGTLMPREVYEARHTALRETVAAQDARLSAEIGELKTQLAVEKEQRRNLFKWVVGAIVVPVILFVGQAIMNAQSAGVGQ